MVKNMTHEHHSEHEHEHEDILSEEDKKYIRDKFQKELVEDVPIILYKSEDCEYCEPLESLLKALAKLSDNKIKLEIKDMAPEIKKELKVDKGPVIIMGKNKEVRYTGAPFGEEGWAFLETIALLSNKNHGFNEYEKQLKNLTKSIRIETIITPSCPYCPYAVLIANRVAIASEGKIISDTIEAYEFPEIADRWNVSAVPTVVLSVGEPYSGEVFVVGLPKDEQLIDKILKLSNGE